MKAIDTRNKKKKEEDGELRVFQQHKNMDSLRMLRLFNTGSSLRSIKRGLGERFQTKEALNNYGLVCVLLGCFTINFFIESHYCGSRYYVFAFTYSTSRIKNIVNVLNIAT